MSSLYLKKLFYKVAYNPEAAQDVNFITCRLVEIKASLWVIIEVLWLVWICIITMVVLCIFLFYKAMNIFIWFWCLLSILLIQIAMKELRERKIPFTIRRYLPDGRQDSLHSSRTSSHSCFVLVIWLCNRYVLTTATKIGVWMNWLSRTPGKGKLEATETNYPLSGICS